MIAHTVKEIMVNFLRREHFLESEARYELGFLFFNELPVTKEYYLNVRRIGAKVTLNRAERLEVWELFENAKNHANFDGFIVAA